MEKKSRSQRNSAVKDLTPRDTQDVKGGTIADTATPSLVKACAAGTHIPEVTIHL